MQRSCVSDACTLTERAERVGWETEECVVDRSRRILASLNWKAGTRSLIALMKCASPKAGEVDVHLGVGAPGACAKVPRSYLHLMTVRDPYERFLSGFDEVLRREARWDSQWIADPNRTMRAFATTVEGNQRGWLAHVTPQYRFACKRPLDAVFYRLEDLADLLRARQCVRHLNRKRDSTQELEASAAGVRHRICSFTRVDARCFFNDTSVCDSVP